MRTDRRRTRLTAQQRREYASDLTAGVPEEVIAEFDASLAAYITEWSAEVLRAALRQSATD